jgi:sulfur relay (sulfurtransferase) complex TusBCD TusD component (DsrE family)
MITIVINDSPYGNERPYNALRLAMALVKQGETDLRIFLMGDAVVCGLAGQRTRRLLQHRKDAEGACSSCHHLRLLHVHGRSRH